MSTGWDNATLKKLKALTGKGLSTAEIGKRLGMSKNAIVGKLNRLGWNPKAGGIDAVPEKTNPAPVKKTKSAPIAPKKTTAVKKAAPIVLKKAPAKATPVSKPVAKKTTTATALKITKLAAARPVSEKNTESAKNSGKNLAMHQRIVRHSLGMASLKSDQCRWPLGDPDSEDFHFCGEPVFSGKPYCFDHCKQAYQFSPTKKK